MKYLFAPWRSSYVESVGKSSGCFLCDAINAPIQEDRKNLVLLRAKRSFVIFNLYPYNAGHLMIVPNEHIGQYELIDEETALEMHRLLKISIKALSMCLSPHGFNVGYNIGRSAGAGLDSHIHMHCVPRWNGDTNFMTSIGKTKVISQSLEELYDRLKPIFDSLWNDSKD
ncbi:MAG: HIT domain-containing protein [Aquificaceae bacterium]